MSAYSGPSRSTHACTHARTHAAEATRACVRLRSSLPPPPHRQQPAADLGGFRTSGERSPQLASLAEQGISCVAGLEVCSATCDLESLRRTRFACTVRSSSETMAFISALSSIGLKTGTVTRVACVTRVPARGLRMQAPSGATMPSMPFLKRPSKLDGSLPGGEGCFDPLGFTEVFSLEWLREAEIKHCRVAMLAVLGVIAQEFGTFDFYNAKSKLQLSPDLHNQFVQNGALQQILLFVCAWEFIVGLPALIESVNGNREPGYFGFDPLKLGGTVGSAQWKRMQAGELRNGRLAMIAFGGFFHQQLLTKQGIIEQLAHFNAIKPN